MNRLPMLFVLCSFLFSLSFTACEWEYTTSSETFDFNLRGTWVTHDPDERYTGSLLIDYNRITIRGFSANQTPEFWGNDSERPFRGLITNVPLRGYSEEGHIYIEHLGTFQAGIPYILWDTGYSWGFDRVEFLALQFDGRQQIMRKE